ncbi:hypothetical protein FGO68_gene15718 [Halteria grandinella]|uniref:Uncharacterized protein n=1 Tax=Halteria grandinella TaxID=5974 RepID=A0A8J8NF71_HALGN|nr:hypothetical protein FGO68_gene15718 [Halteria grandinella]
MACSFHRATPWTMSCPSKYFTLVTLTLSNPQIVQIKRMASVASGGASTMTYGVITNLILQVFLYLTQFSHVIIQLVFYAPNVGHDEHPLTHQLYVKVRPYCAGERLCVLSDYTGLHKYAGLVY